MISYSNFRNLLIEAILFPCRIEPQGFRPHYSTKIEDFDLHLLGIKANYPYQGIYPIGRCIFWHEEPLNHNELENLEYLPLLIANLTTTRQGHEIRDWPTNFESIGMSHPEVDVNIQILANSEKSNLKKQWLKKNNFFDWYFFFHGFAALDWFRDYQYLTDPVDQPDKVFICLNHLIKEKRGYRLYVLSKIFSENLQHQGLISAPHLTQDLIKNELTSNVFLTRPAKQHIYENLLDCAKPIMLDHIDYTTSSADISSFSFKALWNVVTETVYYEEKLHLTEKIFKPIAIQRPFILLGATGNLAYLKSYGFKTFDRWIDESYDNESDPTKRTDLAIGELKKLCSLSELELAQMHNEMKPILEHNHYHFYNTFKKIIVDELIDNFCICIKQYNLGRFTDRYCFPDQLLQHLEPVRKLLMR